MPWKNTADYDILDLEPPFGYNGHKYRSCFISSGVIFLFFKGMLPDNYSVSVWCVCASKVDEGCVVDFWFLYFVVKFRVVFDFLILVLCYDI